MCAAVSSISGSLTFPVSATVLSVLGLFAWAAAIVLAIHSQCMDRNVDLIVPQTLMNVDSESSNSIDLIRTSHPVDIPIVSATDASDEDIHSASELRMPTGVDHEGGDAADMSPRTLFADSILLDRRQLFVQALAVLGSAVLSVAVVVWVRVTVKSFSNSAAAIASLAAAGVGLVCSLATVAMHIAARKYNAIIPLPVRRRAYLLAGFFAVIATFVGASAWSSQMAGASSAPIQIISLAAASLWIVQLCAVVVIEGTFHCQNASLEFAKGGAKETTGFVFTAPLQSPL
jgi:hypothetical protein